MVRHGGPLTDNHFYNNPHPLDLITDDVMHKFELVPLDNAHAQGAHPGRLGQGPVRTQRKLLGLWRAGYTDYTSICERLDQSFESWPANVRSAYMRACVEIDRYEDCVARVFERNKKVTLKLDDPAAHEASAIASQGFDKYFERFPHIEGWHHYACASDATLLGTNELKPGSPLQHFLGWRCNKVTKRIEPGGHTEMVQGLLRTKNPVLYKRNVAGDGYVPLFNEDLKKITDLGGLRSNVVASYPADDVKGRGKVFIGETTCITKGWEVYPGAFINLIRSVAVGSSEVTRKRSETRQVAMLTSFDTAVVEQLGFFWEYPQASEGQRNFAEPILLPVQQRRSKRVRGAVGAEGAEGAEGAQGAEDAEDAEGVEV